MSSGQFTYRNGELVEITTEEWQAHITSLPAVPTSVQLRAAWELAAKKQAARALDLNVTALSRMIQKRDAGAERTSLLNLAGVIEQIPLTTDLSTSTDEKSAYLLMFAVYNAAVAGFSTALKAEFAAQINLIKLTR